MIEQNRFRRLNIILFFLSLVMLVVHIESMVRFNRREIQIHGNDSSGPVQMEIDARADSTSTWLKRSFMLNGRAVDLTGQTIDGTLRNQSVDTLQDWELRINIKGDCYINQAWNGEVEIHQFTGTDREAVQRMNLQNYQLEDVTFEYRYDGDLLIPLQQGDYVIYYPSSRFSEMPIDAGDDVKIGVIFYYLDQLDLSDYDLLLHFHRSFTDGFTFYIFIALLALWALSMTVSGVSLLTYRRTIKEMDLRKSGIFSMSDIYDLIYIIHLPTGEMTPVSVDDKMERERPKNRTAKELLTDVVTHDVEENYRERMLEFVNTDTLAERLKDRNSVAIEFRSQQYGWCAFRFFAMDRTEGKPLEDVVFAVQNINEEKKEQEAVIRQIEAAQSINEAKAAFVDNMAEDLQRPLRDLVALNEKIRLESRDDAIRGYARSACNVTGQLLTLTDGLVDGLGIESGKIELASTAYSLRQVLTDTLDAVRPLAQERGFTVALDVAETLPDRLQGDPRVLREVLVNLTCGCIAPVGGGTLQLATYGKALSESVHLLFSVRVLSDSEHVHGPSGMSTTVVSTLLAGMGSALKTVRSPAGRSDAYFEIEQRVLDAAPIGKLSAEG